MPNTFYYDACNVDARMTPFPPATKDLKPDPEGLSFFVADDESNGVMARPHSIMNDNVAINYRTIYNGYAMFSKDANFTEYSDYERCVTKDKYLAALLNDKRNPTYKNIISYYSSEDFDPYGLARYKMQDFIYLKYYNQIPNNYMITLRRYTRPCGDHMFGLDMPAVDVNRMNGYFDDYFALATAVTYMGDKTGNKLSDILKFDYGANWEDREGKVESLQNPDGGLAAQMKNRGNINSDLLSGESRIGGSTSATGQMKSLWMISAMAAGKGVGMSDVFASQHQYEGNTFSARYGDTLYGDVNVVNKVKIRSRGLTFTNSFSLTFEYSLKSLKCVNPRIAMMDILSNFLILTGNYGTFWGGETIFYGNRNIAPQYGDPMLLRQGKYGAYLRSLAGDVKEGFRKISQTDNGTSGNFFQGLLNGIKNVGSGFLQGLVGNLLGGNIGVAGEGVAVPALLSGAPSGFWHVTVGNPLDPIAMMGNMAVTKTSVQFGDALGYDDFPTEIKFVVELEHCMPRDNSQIENMFNGAKGRFYSFTNGDILNAYKTIDSMQNFQDTEENSTSNMTNQQKNMSFTINGNYSKTSTKHGEKSDAVIKTIGGFLNG